MTVLWAVKEYGAEKKKFLNEYELNYKTDLDALEKDLRKKLGDTQRAFTLFKSDLKAGLVAPQKDPLFYNEIKKTRDMLNKLVHIQKLRRNIAGINAEQRVKDKIVCARNEDYKKDMLKNALGSLDW